MNLFIPKKNDSFLIKQNCRYDVLAASKYEVHPNEFEAWVIGRISTSKAMKNALRELHCLPPEQHLVQFEGWCEELDVHVRFSCRREGNTGQLWVSLEKLYA